MRPQAAKLPRLRFGNWYSFRARAADLAGNDIAVPGAVVCTLPYQYLRYEPVANPVLVLQTPLTEGEHVERLVIRSNPYGPGSPNAATYAANPPATPMNPYSATNVRWLAPPKGAWLTAEAHGRFDAFFNAMSAAMKADAPVAGAGYVDPAFLSAKNALYALSQKERGTFSDPNVWNTAVNATNPYPPNPVTVITPASALNLPAPTTRGNPLQPGSIHGARTDGGRPLGLHPLPPRPQRGGGVPSDARPINSTPTNGAQQVRTWAPRPGCVWPEIDLPQLQLVAATGPQPAGPATAVLDHRLRSGLRDQCAHRGVALPRTGGRAPVVLDAG